MKKPSTMAPKPFLSLAISRLMAVTLLTLIYYPVFSGLSRELLAAILV
jgi:hypothetical protein